MTKKRHGNQITHQCAGLLIATSALCGEPAPYLINGTTFCPLHALALARILMERATGTPQPQARQHANETG